MSDEIQANPAVDVAGAAPAGGNTLAPPPEPGNVPVLQKLSTTPFPRSGFPMLGIMASVYEHATAVAARMRDRRARP